MRQPWLFFFNSDQTLVVRATSKNGDSFSISLDSDNQIVDVEKDDTQSDFNNHITSCTQSYLQSQIGSDSSSVSEDNSISECVEVDLPENENKDLGPIHKEKGCPADKHRYLWVRCENEDCFALNYKKFLKARMNLCDHCGYHFKIHSSDRIDVLIDPGTWDPMNEDLVSLHAMELENDCHCTEEPFLDSIPMDEEKTKQKMRNRETITHHSIGGPNDENTTSSKNALTQQFKNTNGNGGANYETTKSFQKDGNNNVEDDNSTKADDQSAGALDKHTKQEAENNDRDSDQSAVGSALGLDEDIDQETDWFSRDSDPETGKVAIHAEQYRSGDCIGVCSCDWDDSDQSDVSVDTEQEPERDSAYSDQENLKDTGGDRSVDCIANSLELHPNSHDSDQAPSDSDQPNSDGDADLGEDPCDDQLDCYAKRLDHYQKDTGLSEAIQTGVGELNGLPLALGVMDFQFIGGSMGSVVGEKITRLVEYATKQFLPLIIVCASGGARMQEGSLSLLQMAKISSALFDYHANKKALYVSILTSPTTGGVTASFGMLGDIIIAEPNAYIAFAGKRVIEQTLNITVPEGSQEAEYLFEKGLFDLLVPRNLLKNVLFELFKLHAFFPLNSNSSK